MSANMNTTVTTDGNTGVTARAAQREWSEQARFAVYYAPSRDSDWWRAGSAWLGRDAESGEPLTPPQLPELTRELAALTPAPRRYGWHGTWLAPFRPRDGVSSHDVLDAVGQWAQTQSPFTLPVEAATLGDFVALRPADPQGDANMRAIAASALRSLDALRAKPSAADLARRLAAPLTDRQRALLLEWGYPYVFDEFRFHMTLSSSLDDQRERAALVAWWQARTAALGALPVDHAALFVEPEPGAPFVLWQRLPFQTGEVK
jgi:putative phosphonate metabolism protein